jgi:hypothetical protein
MVRFLSLFAMTKSKYAAAFTLNHVPAGGAYYDAQSTFIPNTNSRDRARVTV